MIWQELENKVLSKLSSPIADYIRKTIPLYQGELEEIRL